MHVCVFQYICISIDDSAFFNRDLLKQDRIRLHTNFFLSLALCGVATILWDMLVRYDLLTSKEHSHALMTKNTVRTVN